MICMISVVEGTSDFQSEGVGLNPTFCTITIAGAKPGLQNLEAEFNSQYSFKHKINFWFSLTLNQESVYICGNFMNETKRTHYHVLGHRDGSTDRYDLGTLS